MPLVTIEGPANVSKECKKELIENVSKAVSDAYQIPIQAIDIVIHEIQPDNIGVGGKQLSEKE